MSRWCQFTNKGFRYFENRYKAQNVDKGTTGPLFNVPIEQIGKIVRIKEQSLEKQRNRNFEK